MDKYARENLKSRGVTQARLSVSPSNLRAIAFYKKTGWRDIGPYPGRPGIHLMECDLV
jgi:ribosomal protein S18 acetylase RimI-like enzyme